MRTDVEPEGAPAEPAVHRTETMTIHSVEQRDAAARRVDDLAGCAEGSEVAERAALIDAIQAWDEKSRQRDVGKESV